MIINLYSKSNELKLPFLNLKRDCYYEIGIHQIGGVTKNIVDRPQILRINYNGIYLSDGTHCDTMMTLAFSGSAFNTITTDPFFYPLRTSDLGTSSITFDFVGAENNFQHAYAQIVIRERKTVKSRKRKNNY